MARLWIGGPVDLAETSEQGFDEADAVLGRLEYGRHS
jgi:uncharacterized protein (DUF2384 family)